MSNVVIMSRITMLNIIPMSHIKIFYKTVYFVEKLQKIVYF